MPGRIIAIGKTKIRERNALKEINKLIKDIQRDPFVGMETRTTQV